MKKFKKFIKRIKKLEKKYGFTIQIDDGFSQAGGIYISDNKGNHASNWGRYPFSKSKENNWEFNGL